jgi:hypothetical protein
MLEGILVATRYRSRNISDKTTEWFDGHHPPHPSTPLIGYLSSPNASYVIATTQTPNARGCVDRATKNVYTTRTYANKPLSSLAGNRAFGSHYLAGKAMPPYQ